MSDIILQSSDGQQLKVDIEALKLSATLRIMLFDCCMWEEGKVNEVIPVPNVKGNILELVLKWADHHKFEQSKPLRPPKHLKSKPMTKWQENQFMKKRADDICSWDLHLLQQIDQSDLYDLILAANYLQMDGLQEVCSRIIARQIRGKTPVEIRKQFNIPNEMCKKKSGPLQVNNDEQELEGCNICTGTGTGTGADAGVGNGDGNGDGEGDRKVTNKTQRN